MKKSLHIIALGFAFLVFCSALRLADVLPVDTRPYVEKKYAGWNGVLRAWICTDWNAGGSFTAWLNSCAADFEKAQNGVYIEFTPVNRATMAQLHTGNVRPPDMVFFSPGVLESSDGLLPAQLPGNLRGEFAGYGACPVAMGARLWAVRSGMENAIPDALPAYLPEAGASPGECAALVGLLSGGAAAIPETAEPELDLGLGASAAAGEIIDRFIRGEISAIPVGAKEIARLARLRESGQGVEWELAASGEICCTDQLLLAAAVLQTGADARETQALAQAFIARLCGDEAQDALAKIGAFSVTGRRVHSGLSIYAPLDAMICALPLATPGAFPEYSASAFPAIVRDFSAGRISLAEALEQMRFEYM